MSLLSHRRRYFQRTDSTIELNNKALFYLSEGRQKEAIGTLHDALEHVYHCGAGCGNCFDDESSSSSLSSVHHEQCFYPEHRVNQQQQQQQQPSQSPAFGPAPLFSVPLSAPDSRDFHSSNKSVFSFYHRAFTFNNDRDNSHMNEQMKVIIMYNMGVYHHAEGIRKGGSSTELSIALLRYDMAYSLIKSNLQSFSFDDIWLLLLSLFNNMGHIHSMMMDIEQTRQCYRWLQRTFVSRGCSRELLQDEHYKFFSQYMMLPAREICLLSPAA